MEEGNLGYESRSHSADIVSVLRNLVDCSAEMTVGVVICGLNSHDNLKKMVNGHFLMSCCKKYLLILLRFRVVLNALLEINKFKRKR